MIDAFGGERWWPLNSGAAVLRAHPDRVAEALNPTGRGIVSRFDDLPSAVAARAPYPYGRQDTTFLVASADGGTVVLSSGAPVADLLGSFQWPAQHVLHCQCIAAQWSPRVRRRLAGAGFDDFRPSAPTPPAPGARATDQLTVQVSDQGRRWVFVRIPPGESFVQRGYEDRDSYRARIVADRLPLELIRRYLRAVGIPIDDPNYLAGPVVTVSLARRIDSDITWSTMHELRAAAGYPADGIPTDLRTPLAPDA